MDREYSPPQGRKLSGKGIPKRCALAKISIMKVYYANHFQLPSNVNLHVDSEGQFSDFKGVKFPNKDCLLCDQVSVLQWDELSP